MSCQDQHPVEHPTMSYPGPDILVFTGPPRCTVHLVNTYLFNLSLARKTEYEINYHPGQAQGHRQLTRLSCPTVSWTGTDPTPLLLCLTGIQCPHTWKETKILRSPCGSGTAAVMAAREARGILKLSEEFLHDSILGTRFRGRLLWETKVETIFSLASSYVFFHPLDFCQMKFSYILPS